MLRRIHGEHPSARLMFRSALAEVGRQFPELLLEENERGHLTARIGSKARTLDVPSIDRLWKLNYALLGVLDLVNSHYATQRTAPELAGIGIAAARGIAMALDPRSRLHLPYEWVPSSTVAPSGSNAASVPVEFGRWVCSDRALFVLPLPDAL